jgi:hypothetical protein
VTHRIPTEPTEPTEPSASPALRGGHGSSAARELKFAVELRRIDELLATLAKRMRRDPHADPALDGDYLVTSLYCDSPDREVARRIGWHRFRKFRVRRYGLSEVAFLERKTRIGALVRKERIEIPIGELPFLALDANAHDPAWRAASYRRQLLRRALAPVCMIEYRRTAFYADAAHAGGSLPIRVTLDRSLRGVAVEHYRFAPASPSLAWRPILPDTAILEIKFAGDTAAAADGVPVAVKDLLAALRVSRRGSSKYRTCMRLIEGRDEETPDA